MLNLIKLLKGSKPHQPLAKHNNPTLTALDTLQEVLTKPSKPETATCKPKLEDTCKGNQLPRMPNLPKYKSPQTYKTNPNNNTIHQFN